MNGERGIDLSTDFQRAHICVTITEEKTSLLINNETKELYYSEEPINKKDFINYHLHILYPERDSVTRKKNNSIKGYWSIEEQKITKWRDKPLEGSYYKPVIFDSEIHSAYCRRILASTENLMGVNPEWDKKGLFKNPHLDRTKKKDVYNICNSLIEIYAKMQGELNYVMVHPFYSSHQPIIPGGKRFTSVEYKTDVDNFIAVFPALAYNKARLENQLY